MDLAAVIKWRSLCAAGDEVQFGWMLPRCSLCRSDLHFNHQVVSVASGKCRPALRGRKEWLRVRAPRRPQVVVASMSPRVVAVPRTRCCSVGVEPRTGQRTARYLVSSLDVRKVYVVCRLNTSF